MDLIKKLKISGRKSLEAHVAHILPKTMEAGEELSVTRKVEKAGIKEVEEEEKVEKKVDVEFEEKKEEKVEVDVREDTEEVDEIDEEKVLFIDLYDINPIRDKIPPTIYQMMQTMTIAEVRRLMEKYEAFIPEEYRDIERYRKK